MKAMEFFLIKDLHIDPLSIREMSVTEIKMLYIQLDEWNTMVIEEHKKQEKRAR